MSVVITIKTEKEMDIVGRVLSKLLPKGSAVSLLGTLGAGKTRLVQAVAQAYGVPKEEVGSPTFVLIREYLGKTVSIYHFDAYRLNTLDEFYDLGINEYFDSEGISFVEWADKVIEAMPKDRLEITIEPIDASSRRLTFESKASFDPTFEEKLRERWAIASSPRLK